MGPALRPVDGAKSLPPGEVILVGKVELTPALEKDEQELKGFGTAGLRNAVVLLLDPRTPTLEDDPALQDYSGRIEAQLGKTFFVSRRPGAFFIRAGVIVTRVDAQGQKRAYLPGGLRVDVRPGDRAVYVGTLRYSRDEFFKIRKASVEDEYEQAATAFRKRFGGLPLRRALAVKP